MTNEKAFRLYLAVRLHFLTNFDVFESKGRFRGQNKVLDRKDVPLITELIKKANNNERELIEICVSNFLYGNDKFLYDHSSIDENYAHWSTVKQTISHCLDRDLSYIDLQLMKKQCSLNDYLNTWVISDLFSRKIEYESLIILDRKLPVIDSIAGFEGDKYKVRMHKANRFVTKGVLAELHSSRIDNFISNIT